MARNQAADFRSSEISISPLPTSSPQFATAAHLSLRLGNRPSQSNLSKTTWYRSNWARLYLADYVHDMIKKLRVGPFLGQPETHQVHARKHLPEMKSALLHELQELIEVHLLKGPGFCKTASPFYPTRTLPLKQLSLARPQDGT